MKKLIVFTILIGLCLVNTAFAGNRDAGRQISYELFSETDDGIIRSTSGTVFSITMRATNTSGWVALYDVSDGTTIISTTEPKIEIQEATQYNTGNKEFPAGLEFHNGIHVEGKNVQAFVYYY